MFVFLFSKFILFCCASSHTGKLLNSVFSVFIYFSYFLIYGPISDITDKKFGGKHFFSITKECILVGIVSIFNLINWYGIIIWTLSLQNHHGTAKTKGYALLLIRLFCEVGDNSLTVHSNYITKWKQLDELLREPR